MQAMIGGNVVARTEAQRRAAKKYNSTHTDQIRFDAPKGFKERVQQAAQAEGVSTSFYMRRAILEALERSHAAAEGKGSE